MKLTGRQISELLKKREDERVEFKRAAAALPENIWETYSAFCNTDGGTSDASGDNDTRGDNKLWLIKWCADELGSGTRNLYHYTRLYSGADPIIDEEDAFSVAVPLNDAYSPEVGKGAQDDPPVNPPDSIIGTTSGPLSGLKSGLNETDSKLIGFIQSNPNVTIQELQKMLKLSRNGVKKALARLKDSGHIRRVGPDKGGHWEVVER